MDFPGFARHLIALKCNSSGDVYYEQAIPPLVVVDAEASCASLFELEGFPPYKACKFASY